jgi:predicted transcriptional regulator
MPRNAHTTPRERVNLDFDAGVKQELLELKKEMRADSMAETLRRSMQTCRTLNRLLAPEGAELIVRQADGSETRILIV